DLRAVVVAPAPDEAARARLELVDEPLVHPVPGVDDDVGSFHRGPHLLGQGLRALGPVRIGEEDETRAHPSMLPHGPRQRFSEPALTAAVRQARPGGTPGRPEGTPPRAIPLRCG